MKSGDPAVPSAVARARTALQAMPMHPGLHYNLGVALLEAGQTGAAGAEFLAATRLKPDFPQAWNNLGLALEDQGHLEEAVGALQRAIVLDPKYANALRNLGRVALRMGDADLARNGLRRLAELQPDNWPAQVAAALALPAVPASVDAAATARRTFADGLDHLTEMMGRPAADLDKCRRTLEQQTNFFLAYQGEDDRDLQVRYGRLVRQLVEGTCAERSRDGEPITGRPIRVGFASAFFRDCTVGHYFRSWVTELDPQRFQVWLYLLGNKEDDLTRSLAAAAYRTVRIDDHLTLSEAAGLIGGTAPDVLIYPELGMHGRTYLLAALRLAPVQCVAWGHPVTSGLPTIDYFLSCESMEPPNAQRFYAEKLLCLPGIGTRYSPLTADQTLTRADFGLPEGARLYLVPHPPYKFHPEEDARIAEILARDPEGLLVFCTGVEPIMSRQLFRRLAPSMADRGVAMERLLLLPHLSRTQYLALNRLCDLLLDTSRWSGGNTSLDALSVGLPVVTRPGVLMRSRQTAAMLEMLGVPELIAGDDDRYVTLALTVAGRSELREQVCRKIANARGRLFDRREPIEALSGAIVDMTNERVSAPTTNQG